MSQTDTIAESGVLLVDKPSDWTSHDVVNCVRRRFRFRKVGHCGTLDPAATGLLVLLLGRATKLSERLMNQDKVYAGTMRLGIETDSQDRDGQITATHDIAGLTEEDVRRAAQSFVGTLMQTPPMVSAVKKDGKPLYKLARKGQVVEREPRQIVIHNLTIGDVRMPDIDFEVSCGKGTYIRTLCADIGTALGCGAHLHSLRRLRSGSFSVDDAYTIDRIKSWEREQLMDAMIPLGDLLVRLMDT
jgi:tRNA pseudouridine55 synthase